MTRNLLLRLPALLFLLVVASFGARAAIEESPSAQPRNRVAIVVGNSHYQSQRLEQLPNAANDAVRLADSLRRLNFEVLVGTDLTSQGFARLLADAEKKVPSASAILIFYAGHGVQLQGENYLLPVDTPDPESMEKITAGAVKLNDVIARFASRDRQTFIFLDACRNNPIGRPRQSATAWRRSRSARTPSWPSPRSPATLLWTASATTARSPQPS